jgi:hypothetical protein
MRASHDIGEFHADQGHGSWPQRLLAGLFVVLLALAACYAAAGEPDHRGAPTTLALAPYMGALRTVDVTIGKLELPFVFDTGGGDTFVTPAVASAVGCTPYGRLVGFRMSGERVDSPRCGKLPLRIAGVDRDVEVAVFDIMSLLPDGVPELGGIVSLHTLRS